MIEELNFDLVTNASCLGSSPMDKPEQAAASLAVDWTAQQQFGAVGDGHGDVAKTISQMLRDGQNVWWLSESISAICNSPSQQALSLSLLPRWKEAATKILDNQCLLLNPPMVKWEALLTVSVLLIVFLLDKEPRYLPDTYKKGAN